MEISKRSWHYRLISLFYPAPTNLCLYVWAFLGIMLLLPLVPFYPLGRVVANFADRLADTPGDTERRLAASGSKWLVGVGFIGIVSIIFGPVVLFAILLTSLLSRPKFLWAWLAARKGHYCPRLIFTN